MPLSDYNRPKPGMLRSGTMAPVICEAAFRYGA
jgi:hypothetical protein